MSATTDDTEPTGLTSLPPELVASILDFVDPPALVDFACSSVYLAQCSRDILKQHQLAHQYKTCTDILPTTIPALLRKVREDRITAWHVRDLEFCYHRTDWARWKEFRFEIEESSNMRGRPPPPEYAFGQDERVELLDLLREKFRFSEGHVDAAREDLEKGNDAPIKLLVFAFCPRIRSVKFSRHGNVNGRDAFQPVDLTDPTSPRRSPRSVLDYIQRAINLHPKDDDGQDDEQAWCAGFSSLSYLGVGVETGTEIDELSLHSPPHLFTDLMHLPSLRSIYFHGLAQEIDEMIADDQDGTVAPYNIREGTSELEHIFLDSANGLSWKFRKAMIGGCGELFSLAITNSEMDDIDALVQEAAHFHKDTMETLMFYETSQLHGYRCNMFRPEELNRFNNLRTIYVDASDVMLDAMYNHEGDGDHQAGQDHEWMGDCDFFIEFFMNSCFPESMEVLVLGNMRGGRTLDGDVDFLDQAIETMIEAMHEPEDDENSQGEGSESSSKTFERRFPNLKAIYLGGLDELLGDRGYSTAEPRKKRWFSRAIAAGRKAGVDVHTRTTRIEPFHKIDFPTPPSVADLKSAPEPPQAPLQFDMYTGRWGPRSCGNCGDCEKCLQQYDRSVWELEQEEERRKELFRRRTSSLTSNEVRERFMLGAKALRESKPTKWQQKQIDKFLQKRKENRELWGDVIRD